MSSSFTSSTGITVSLKEPELWKKFYDLGTITEMIVTRNRGRMLFPQLKYEIKGLEKNEIYSVHLYLERVDGKKYRYKCGEWEESGRGEKLSTPIKKENRDGRRTGFHWMSKGLLFDDIRITSNKEVNDDENTIRVYSLHKYQPVITVGRWNSGQVDEEFRLGMTEFIAVTTYANPMVADLKKMENKHSPIHVENDAKKRRKEKMAKRPIRHNPTTTVPDWAPIDSFPGTLTSLVAPPTFSGIEPSAQLTPPTFDQILKNFRQSPPTFDGNSQNFSGADVFGSKTSMDQAPPTLAPPTSPGLETDQKSYSMPLTPPTFDGFQMIWPSLAGFGLMNYQNAYSMPGFQLAPPTFDQNLASFGQAPNHFESKPNSDQAPPTLAAATFPGIGAQMGQKTSILPGCRMTPPTSTYPGSDALATPTMSPPTFVAPIYYSTPYLMGYGSYENLQNYNFQFGGIGNLENMHPPNNNFGFGGF